MIVKKQKKIEFINDCNCIVDYIELEKAILWYQEKPTSRLKHIYLHGNYPAVTIFNKKIHIHRLLMMYWTNNKDISSKIYVHHIDENKLNASKNNLEFIDVVIHQSKHNKGKIITEKQKEAIRKSNHKRLGRKYKNIYENKELLEGE